MVLRGLLVRFGENLHSMWWGRGDSPNLTITFLDDSSTLTAW